MRVNGLTAAGSDDTRRTLEAEKHRAATPVAALFLCAELPQRARRVILAAMAKKGPASVRIVKRVPVNRAGAVNEPPSPPAGRPSSLLDTRVIYCGDCLEQLRKLPEKCIDLIYIDPPFNSNRNYEVFWGETKAERTCSDFSSHGRVPAWEAAQRVNALAWNHAYR